MVGNSGHRNRLARGLAPGRQRDIQQPRRFFGIVEEQLIKITHAVEQQLVGMLCLDAQVLLHHWCVFVIACACFY